MDTMQSKGCKPKLSQHWEKTRTSLTLLDFLDLLGDALGDHVIFALPVEVLLQELVVVGGLVEEAFEIRVGSVEFDVLSLLESAVAVGRVLVHAVLDLVGTVVLLLPVRVVAVLRVAFLPE